MPGCGRRWQLRTDRAGKILATGIHVPLYQEKRAAAHPALAARGKRAGGGGTASPTRPVQTQHYDLS